MSTCIEIERDSRSILRFLCIVSERYAEVGDNLRHFCVLLCIVSERYADMAEFLRRFCVLFAKDTQNLGRNFRVSRIILRIHSDVGGVSPPLLRIYMRPRQPPKMAPHHWAGLSRRVWGGETGGSF